MKHKSCCTITLSVVIVFLTLTACGGSNEGTGITPVSQEAEPTEVPTAMPVVQEAEPTEVPAAIPVVQEAEPIEQEKEPKPSIEIHQVGDLIEVDEHTIRLNSVEYQETVLIANFTIENQGSSDLNVSRMLSFSARKSDGTKLEQEIFDCGTSSLDGKVLGGDRLRGSICWSGIGPDDGTKIYYEAELFGSGAVV